MSEQDTPDDGGQAPPTTPEQTQEREPERVEVATSGMNLSDALKEIESLKSEREKLRQESGGRRLENKALRAEMARDRLASAISAELSPHVSSPKQLRMLTRTVLSELTLPELEAGKMNYDVQFSDTVNEVVETLGVSRRTTSNPRNKVEAPNGDNPDDRTVTRKSVRGAAMRAVNKHYDGQGKI